MPNKLARNSIGKDSVHSAVDQLKKLATKKTREGMTRYGLPNHNAIGVAVGDMRRLAKQLGHSHSLAVGLWDEGFYEARMLAVFVEEVEKLSPAQMDRWTKDFDNWGICDTACFHLFDRSPNAHKLALKWAGRKREFEKRTGFALMASLALHDKRADDEAFVPFLAVIEAQADDDRNFVKKGVSWALRGIGRRNAKLRAVAFKVAQRLSASEAASARWIGKDALREFKKAKLRT